MSGLGKAATVGLALAGCTPEPERREPPDWGTTLTDTFPQFRGRPPKNVVMISMDTFRRDHLDRYGVHAGVTPYLTSLAAAGVALDAYTSCSNWTFAATSCTLSGKQNEDAGMIPLLSESAARPWPTGTDFLATYLAEAGFWSVAVSTNGWFAPQWNNTDGYSYAKLATTGSAWGAYEEAREALDDARSDGRADGRWFLHVHTVEPHAPYDPPPEYLGEVNALPPAPWDLSNRDVHYDERDAWGSLSAEERELLDLHLQARYRAELRYLDDTVRRIVEDLYVDGLLQDALVVFWTDHGEAFWEHDHQTHAFSLFREENDGIAFFWAPNIVPASVDTPTSAVDLVPTILAALELPVPDGLSGLPLPEIPEGRPRFASAIARLGPLSSVRQGDDLLVFSWYGTVSRYDLATDPGELDDLHDPAAVDDRTRALWALLRPQVERQAALAPQYPVRWPAELEAP